MNLLKFVLIPASLKNKSQTCFSMFGFLMMLFFQVGALHLSKIAVMVIVLRIPFLNPLVDHLLRFDVICIHLPANQHHIRFLKPHCPVKITGSQAAFLGFVVIPPGVAPAKIERRTIRFPAEERQGEQLALF